MPSPSSTLALHTAAAAGVPLAVLAARVAAAGDVDARDARRRTALHEAAAHGRVAAVRYLVAEAGADILARDGDGRTPFALALQSPGGLPAAEYLGQQTILAQRIRGGSTRELDALLLPSIPAWHGAPAADDAPALLLLAIGANPDGVAAERERGGHGQTPLMLAARLGERHARLVRALLEAGADVGLRDAGGATAFRYAISGRSAAVVDMLLAHGCFPSLPADAIPFADESERVQQHADEESLRPNVPSVDTPAAVAARVDTLPAVAVRQAQSSTVVKATPQEERGSLASELLKTTSASSRPVYSFARLREDDGERWLYSSAAKSGGADDARFRHGSADTGCSIVTRRTMAEAGGVGGSEAPPVTGGCYDVERTRMHGFNAAAAVTAEGRVDGSSGAAYGCGDRIKLQPQLLQRGTQPAFEADAAASSVSEGPTTSQMLSLKPSSGGINSSPSVGVDVQSFRHEAFRRACWARRAPLLRCRAVFARKAAGATHCKETMRVA